MSYRLTWDVAYNALEAFYSLFSPTKFTGQKGPADDITALVLMKNLGTLKNDAVSFKAVRATPMGFTADGFIVENSFCRDYKVLNDE